MRILHVTHNFPRWDGDFSGSFLQALARRQVALGHDVSVLAPHAAGAPLAAVEGGVEVRRFRYGADAAETLAYTGTLHEAVRSSWRGRWRFLRFLASEASAVHSLVRGQAPDVIHVHWWFPNGLAIWPRRPAGTSAVVITAHGTDVFLLRSLRWLRPLARRVLRSADAVSSVSHLLAADLATLGVAAVSVIPMPLDWDIHGLRPDSMEERERDHILFVGRLTAQKGTAHLVEAFAQLSRTRPTATLTIVGDGPERAALSALTVRLGLEGRVTFLGTRPPREVAALYRRASVLAMPATTGRHGEREGFGLVAVEAMLAGLPVVATATGGLVDIIDNESTGLLVPEGDSDALARSLERFLAGGPFAGTVARHAREVALSRFAPDSLARAYVALYHDAMTHAASTPRSLARRASSGDFS